MDVAFVLGCPRSGTTWLQMLLAQHEAVATARETHVFSRYLHPLDARWRREEHRHAERGRDVGLVGLLTQAEFDARLESLSTLVLRRMLESRPGSRVVVEKTPGHVRVWPLAFRLHPDARFVHVVRDPRAVAASMMHASRGWGGAWAPAGAVEAARRWREDVLHARALAASGARFRQIRYEDLHARPEAELAELYAWLGLPATTESCAEAVERCRIDRAREAGDGAFRQPAQFFRKGAADGWRRELSRGRIAAVEHVAGDLMAELGYRRTTRGSALRVRAHDAVEAVRRALDWRLRALRERI